MVLPRIGSLRDDPAFDPPSLLLHEPEARRLILVQALEEGDPEGRLVGLIERSQAEREALTAVGDPAQGRRLDERAYLLERARRLLDLLGHRQPRLAGLQQRPTWQAWAAWGLPLAALLAGALIDRIDNPRQVNLLSPPLLAFLLWNVAMYVLLAVAGIASLVRGRPLAGPWQAFANWGMPRGAGPRAEIAARFQRTWWQVAARMEAQRWRAILHASAAAWAVGVALSIVAGGLVREYRIGWESTLLELPQVHAFLSALFAPVVAVLPLEPFTQAELARLHFGSGADIGRAEARRWVFLYVALLGVLVVLPRGVLALVAAFRRRQRAAHLKVDLASPYFQQVLGRVRPARVVLGLVGDDLEAHPLAMTLRQMAEHAPAAGTRAAWEVLHTARGDALQVFAWHAESLPAASPGTWWRRWTEASHAAQRPRADLLVLDGETWLERVRPMLTSEGPAVLLLCDAGERAAAAVRALPARAGMLSREALATWREDERLWPLLRQLLPPYVAPGVERLADRWREQADQRLERAMRLLADELLQDARDTEELRAQPLGVRQLVVRGERQATQEGRRHAHVALLARARARQADTDARLLALHALEGVLPSSIQDDALPERFRVAQAVHEPQAGLAGAAGGAAMGAAVDLATGGLTLGAASALGALIGGGAALAAAAWKNRGADPDLSVVAFSDETLEALAGRALLRYLGVVHERRPATAAAAQRWGEVVAQVLAREREALIAAWRRARSDVEAPEAASSLAAVLRRMASQALEDLHGPVR